MGHHPGPLPGPIIPPTDAVWHLENGQQCGEAAEAFAVIAAALLALGGAPALVHALTAALQAAGAPGHLVAAMAARSKPVADLLDDLGPEWAARGKAGP